ncbi:MAG: RNA polymerase sigma-70 factor (ECF subfamily) [Saprospiraceae bacterium]|jgi:RNA polymerase sigma-70 factor (ECF subfamily)
MEFDKSEDKGWLAQLLNDDEKGLQSIFDRYYKYLVVTAYKVVNDDHQARDIVQEVFFDFWKKRAQHNINISLKSYLRRAVVNRSIDYLRSKKRIGSNEEITDYNQPANTASIQDIMETNDLQAALQAGIDSLPTRCREVFSLSRFEDLSHKEIATKLDISVKTIENQMIQALKTLAKSLSQLPNSNWLVHCQYWKIFYQLKTSAFPHS